MGGSLPCRSGAGGLARLVACLPYRRCTRRGACFLCRPPALPLACFPAPHPPAPSPMGKGVTKVISCKGLRPLHPQHLTACGTYSPCRTGTPTEWRAFFNPDSRRPGGCQRSVQCRKNRFSTSKTSAASRPALGDARGEAPCIRKQKISPFPPGRGQGGMGAGKQAKGTVGRQQTRQAPPPGAWFAPISQCRPGSALGDARGEAPCIRKQKISPFPPGRGQGGWGQESKLKAGQASGKKGKTPQGTAGAGRAIRKKANTQIIQATATAAFRVAVTLRIYSPQSFLRKILKTSCNLRRIVV